MIFSIALLSALVVLAVISINKASGVNTWAPGLTTFAWMIALGSTVHFLNTTDILFDHENIHSYDVMRILERDFELENPRMIERHPRFAHIVFDCTKHEDAGYVIEYTNNDNDRERRSMCCTFVGWMDDPSCVFIDEPTS
jgi:hypothetical protein